MLDDLFHKDILNCKRCELSWKEPKDYNSKPEWELPPQWQFWAKNKFPCRGNVYYTLYRFDPIRRMEPNVVFVGLRPSTGHIPSISDILFANALIECGLAREKFSMDGDRFIYYETDVLVTDLICCRGLAKEKINAKHVKTCIDYLIAQFKLLEKYYGSIPKIIAIGTITKHKLELKGVRRHLQEIGTKIMATVPHYGRRRKPEEYIKEFKNTLRKERIVFK